MDNVFLLCLLAFAGVLTGCILASWDVLNPYGPEQTYRRVGRRDD